MRFTLGLLSCLLLAGCSASPSPSVATERPASTDPQASVEAAPTATARAEDPIDAAVNATDRDADDRALDAGRKPSEMLRFYGIEPGMRVAELMAGRGYTAELLARVVGTEGEVYGQNNAWVLERFAEAPWSARLEKPVNANVIRVDQELEDPLPKPAHDLDAVFLVLFYHDAVWMKVDRAKMNQAIFAALKPGGVYAVVDHSARKGGGLNEVKTLHRIEESVVRAEIEAAGFVLDAEGDFLRNPDDTRDWSASPSAAGEQRGMSDRFVLRYVKPKG